MPRRRWVVLGLTGAVILLVIVTQALKTGDAREHTLTVGDLTYVLETVTTADKQRQGLSGRPDMAPDRGMLFVYGQQARHCFWMKNMKFPLDIIWLDARRSVVHIERNLSPDTYPESFCPDNKAKYVIELNTGEADRAGIRQGSVLNF